MRQQKVKKGITLKLRNSFTRTTVIEKGKFGYEVIKIRRKVYCNIWQIS
jgi:hypothetical protein